jgi:parvulin-like peptidyl-prolyl isomerase
LSHKSVKTFAAVALLGVLVGCGESGGDGAGAGQEKVVASAGDVNVTLAEFHASLNRITPTYRPDLSTLEAKRSFANDLINKEILLAEGERMGGLTDPGVLSAIDENRDAKMLQILYRAEIADKVEVGGKDVADLYEKRQKNVKMSHILLDSVESAESIRADIVSGKMTFAEAAKRHSLDRNSKNSGGDLGEQYWSMGLSDFQLYAFDLPKGEISEPFESSIGVHLLRVDDIVTPELGTLEEMRTPLRSEARRQMENTRMRDYLRELEQQGGLTWNEEGLQLVLELMLEEAKQDIDTIPQAEQNLPDATEEQRAVVLATFSGRTWTVGDHLGKLRTQPPNLRPAGQIPLRGLKELIRTTELQNEFLVQEALKRGMDQDPEIIAERERIYERILIEQVHSRFVQAVDITDDELRALYDSTAATNPDALLIPERVDMVVLVHTDEAKVREGLRRIAAGEDEAAVIAEISMDERSRNGGGRTGLVGRGNYSPQIEDQAFAAEVGSGWSEPVVTQSGTGAFRVVAKEAPRQATFDEVAPQLTTTLAQGRGEQAFEDWLRGERDRRGVELHDDVLELIGQSVS